MTRRFLVALFLALSMAGTTTVVVLHANGGPYNTNPPYCRSSTPLDPLWWWYECMYPDDPEWGKAQ